MTRWSALAVLMLTACTTASAPEQRRPTVVLAVAPPDPMLATDEPVAEPPSGPDPLIGTWEGTGIQNDGQRWPMVVSITSVEPGRCATVEYPSIPCSAEWHCGSRASDGTLVAVERLTEGRDRCVDDGSLGMRVTGTGQLEWSWEGSGMTARATLSRSR